jgi:RHS repeat-associated protein
VTGVRRGVAALIGLLVVMTLVPAVAIAAAAPAMRPTDPQREASVPMRPVPVLPRNTDPAPHLVLKEPPAVTWPAAARHQVALTGLARAGDSPVHVGPATTAHGATTPVSVQVEVLPRQASVPGGLVLRLTRTDGLRTQGRVRLAVDYAGFRHAFGADWATRLRLVALPECALRTPDSERCRPRAVGSTNDGHAARVSAEVTVDNSLYALIASSGGEVGDLAATGLSPSGSWSAGGSSGDFTWSYPLRVPPAPGGDGPTLLLGYSSGSVDGRTSSTNNQPSWVGEGFDLPVGFVERRYTACADDGNVTGDLCWGTDNAFVTLAGRTAELIRDDNTGAWRMRDDDGSRVERFTGAGNGDEDNGERWTITTNDGTQYLFGSRPTSNSTWTVPVFGNNAGEPCHQATFAASSCRQAWRWNLDEVIDPNKNTTTFFYQVETNRYGRNNGTVGADYHRGGWLERIEYGTRVGSTGSAPAQVVFTPADRCITPGATCVSSNQPNWPDTPWDRHCASGTCATQTTPTFWTQKRLASITTQVWGGSSYRDVDSWELVHQFLDPGDTSSAALWLEAIRRTGKVGGYLGVPEVNFDSEALSNRVDGIDTLLPLVRHRVSVIHTETGGAITVRYLPRECSRPNAVPASPDANTMRCFPTNWTPDGQPQLLDWFHKYVVDTVTESDLTGGGRPILTTYQYPTPPAWHHDDEDGLVPASRKTWSQWRGYAEVGVITGDDTVTRGRTVIRYLQGMDDDKKANGTRRDVIVTDALGGTIEDHELFAGQEYERTTYVSAADPAVLSTRVTRPWMSGATATNDRAWGAETAHFTDTGSVSDRTTLSAGGTRTTQTINTYDLATGLLTATSDLGDASTPADDRCARTTYAQNAAANMTAYVSRVEVVGVACTDTPTYPADLVRDERTHYDGENHGVPPTKGDITLTEIAKGWNGSAPEYVTTSRAAHDSHGRVIEFWDSAGQRSTTAYTPSSGGPVTQTVTTNPLGHTITTTLEPAWGLPVAVVDANGRRTDSAYDALGRVRKVWLPGRTTDQIPNTEYEYLVRTDGVNVVTTKTLLPDGVSALSSYALFDGLLRPRQTQARSPGITGGRIINETHYDSRGLAVKTSGPHYNASAAGTSLSTPISDVDVRIQTLTEYDGAGRPTASIQRQSAIEKWRTTTTYGGDRVSVDPPVGATPTTTVTDVRGRTIQLIQYTGSGPTGPSQTTSYTHTDRDELATVTDPAGNVWTYTYDLRGLRTGATDPDRGTTTTTHNDAGQTLTTTDARGEVLAYTYDALSRRTSVRDDTVTGAVRAEWEYDTTVAGQQANGMTVRSTRYHGGQAFTRSLVGLDSAGRPTSTSVVVPSTEGLLQGTYTTSRTYNANGSVATTVLPAGGGLGEETLTTGHSPLGLPVTLSSTAGTYVAATTYTEFGEPSQLALSNPGAHVWHTSFYDAGTRRLTQTKLQRETTGLTQADLNYSYDQAGNLTRIADKPPGLTADHQCFRYDGLRRLTEAWTPATDNCTTNPTVAGLGGAAPYWHSYTHDAVGNRLTETFRAAAGTTTHTYTYPPPAGVRPHAVGSVAVTGPGGPRTDSYTYDATGNTLSRPGHTLTWDAEGRLATDTAGSGVTSFVYDADGERLIRRSPAEVVLYLDGQELRLASGSVSCTRYYSFAGRPIGVRTTGAGLTWLAADHHGTAQYGIDPTSLAVSRSRTTPYGAVRGAAPSWPGDRGFIGGTTDPTGLIRLGARYYDPAAGRFVSVDPLMDLSDPQQMHGYAYANNNPTTWSDPTGLLPSCGGPDGIGCQHPVSQHGYSAADLGPGGAYQKSRAQFIVNQRKKVLRDQNERRGGRGPDGGRPIPVAQTAGTPPGGVPSWDKLTSCLGMPSSGCSPQDVAAAAVYAGLGGPDAEECLSSRGVGAACKWFLAGFIPGAGVASRGIRLGLKLFGRHADDAADLARRGCGTNSFTPDTPVLMADGTTKPIAAVKVGDLVLATDPDTGESGPRPVTHLITGHGPKTLVTLTIDTDGPHGTTTATLTATHNHPLWNHTTHTWTNAANLHPGDTLTTPTGQPAPILTTHTRHHTHHVHNLTIADLHTYYVLAGDIPVLVHNSGPSCGVPIGGKNGDHLGGEDFHGSEYSLDEIAEFVKGHTGDGNPMMRRPSAAEVETTLRQAGPRQIERQNSSRFDHNGVRVIVNWEMPWKSTAYYPGR